MSHVRMVAPLCWPFELSPLNEFYRGQLVRFITLIHFEIFRWYFVDICIWSRRYVVFKNGCSPLLHFWVISLESTLEWKACALNSYTLLRYFDGGGGGGGGQRSRNAIIFLFMDSYMCFGCSKEPSHWDGSFEHPQHMFWMWSIKIIFQNALFSGGLYMLQ